MSDENSLANVEEDGNVERAAAGKGGGPVYDLSKQLQILNLGDGNGSKRRKYNFLSAPLQSIENLNTESKKIQSNTVVPNFISSFRNKENEDANRNLLDEFSSIDTEFMLNIDTFLTGTIKPSGSKRSLTDLESLMCDSVQPEHTGKLSTPPKSENGFSMNTNSVDDVLVNQLLSGSESWVNPFENYFGATSAITTMASCQRSESFDSTTKVTDTTTQTVTCVEENSGQLLLRIATPYKTKTVPVHGLDSEESEYSKKRDLLMQSDKKLYSDRKPDGESTIRVKGRSLVSQMEEAFNCTKTALENGESTSISKRPKTDCEDPEVDDEKTCSGLTNIVEMWCEEEFNRISESVEKALKILPKCSKSEFCESVGQTSPEVNATERPRFITTPDPSGAEIEGKKQVTFALSDEIIQITPMSVNEHYRSINETSPYEQELPKMQHENSTDETSSVATSVSVETNSCNAESIALLTSPSETDSMENYVSLSSSINANEDTFIVGTPLTREDQSKKLENWLDTCCIITNPENTSKNADASMILLSDSDSDNTEDFASLNSTYKEGDETVFIGGTPLSLKNEAIQPDSCLDGSPIPNSLDDTFILHPESDVKTHDQPEALLAPYETTPVKKRDVIHNSNKKKVEDCFSKEIVNEENNDSCENEAVENEEPSATVMVSENTACKIPAQLEEKNNDFCENEVVENKEPSATAITSEMTENAASQLPAQLEDISDEDELANEEFQEIDDLEKLEISTVDAVDRNENEKLQSIDLEFQKTDDETASLQTSPQTSRQQESDVLNISIQTKAGVLTVAQPEPLLTSSKKSEDLNDLVDALSENEIDCPLAGDMTESNISVSETKNISRDVIDEIQNSDGLVIDVFHSTDHDEGKVVDVSIENEICIQSPSKVDTKSFVQRVESINQNSTIDFSDAQEIGATNHVRENDVSPKIEDPRHVMSNVSVTGVLECKGEEKFETLNSELHDISIEEAFACRSSTCQENDGVKTSTQIQSGLLSIPVSKSPLRISEKSGKPDSPVHDSSESRMDCLTGSPNKSEPLLEISENSEKPVSPVSDSNEKKIDCLLTGSLNKNTCDALENVTNTEPQEMDYLELPEISIIGVAESDGEEVEIRDLETREMLNDIRSHSPTPVEEKLIDFSMEIETSAQLPAKVNTAPSIQRLESIQESSITEFDAEEPEGINEVLEHDFVSLESTITDSLERLEVSSAGSSEGNKSERDKIQDSELPDISVEDAVACWISTCASERQENDEVETSLGIQSELCTIPEREPLLKISENSEKPDTPVSDSNEKKMDCLLTGSPNKSNIAIFGMNDAVETQNPDEIPIEEKLVDISIGAQSLTKLNTVHLVQRLESIPENSFTELSDVEELENTSDTLENVTNLEFQKIDYMEKPEISITDVAEGDDQVEMRDRGTQDTSHSPTIGDENLIHVPTEIGLENPLPEGSLEESVCSAVHTNEDRNSTGFFNVSTDQRIPTLSNDISLCEDVVDNTSHDINITQKIPVSSPIGVQNFDELNVSIMAGLITVESPQRVQNVDTHEDECANSPIDGEPVLEEKYVTRLQDSTFDLIRVYNTQNVEEKVTDITTDVEVSDSGPASLDQLGAGQVDLKNPIHEDCVTTCASFLVNEEPTHEENFEKCTTDTGDITEAQSSMNCETIFLRNSLSPPKTELDSSIHSKTKIIIQDTDIVDDMNIFPLLPAEEETIENQTSLLRSQGATEPGLLETVLSENIPCTPVIAKTRGLVETGAKRQPATITTLRENLDELLTPLRENISRFCTPMSTTARSKNVSRSDIPMPFFTLEHSEDDNKTRLVVELPTNLLDVSVSTLDNMLSIPESGLDHSLTLEKLNAGIRKEENILLTEESNNCEALQKRINELEEERDELKSMASILCHNESELKKAYDKANDCIRILENRYEMFKDYTTKYICDMNVEFDKLETDLKKSNDENEELRKLQLAQEK